MGAEAKQILAAFNSLPAKDRERVLEKMQAIRVPDDLDEDWLAEIDRRMEEHLAGGGGSFTWDEVRKGMRERVR